MASKTAAKKPAAKTETSDARTLVQVRLPPDLLEAIDEEAERLSKEREGEPVNRSEIVRILIRRGLAASKK